MASKLAIGDLVTPANGPWHGLVGVVTEIERHLFEEWEYLIEFSEPIENFNGLPTFDHYFEVKDLIKLDEAGKLLYAKE
jgi:hypothetical protein